ncbi:MAG: hypothetical protein HYV42_05935 [Candidatus Magasanikbacteria bacterium]|nr:hypothetical protein [Candidatus Magasanikbacteria bacterium]
MNLLPRFSIGIIFLVAITLLPTILFKYAQSEPLPHPRLIAHAGGSVNGLRYTNSREALETSYAEGFRWFELDLEVTSDGELVLLHDWDYILRNHFGVAPGVRSLAEFKTLGNGIPYTTLSVAELADWLTTHPDVYLITDIKKGRLRRLVKLRREFPRVAKRIVPQIYTFWHYLPVRLLGFSPPILTLYANNYSEARVLRFAKRAPLWAVTLPAERALESELPKQLQQRGIITYAHLVDTPELARRLRSRGVFGFYTALLSSLDEETTVIGD